MAPASPLSQLRDAPTIPKECTQDARLKGHVPRRDAGNPSRRKQSASGPAQSRADPSIEKRQQPPRHAPPEQGMSTVVGSAHPGPPPRGQTTSGDPNRLGKRHGAPGEGRHGPGGRPHPNRGSSQQQAAAVAEKAPRRRKIERQKSETGAAAGQTHGRTTGAEHDRAAAGNRPE